MRCANTSKNEHQIISTSMKELSIFLFVFCLGLSPSDKVDRRDKGIVVLFYQQHVQRPVGISQQAFWTYRSQFDTIEIQSEGLKSKIKGKLLNLDIFAVDDINYQAALIIPISKNQKDTIYTDRFFETWKIHDKIYIDTSRFFEKLFVNFFDDQLN